uniref:Heat shock protein, alpha-crystallin-related, b6 n=1 Tax=Oreochromis niloticus TaxID=8128 RepID=A0A669DQX9_ORENI
MNLERLPNEEKLSLCRKYYLDVKRSALGLLLWVAVLTTWITIYQHFRAEWGEVGDYLSFTIPLEMDFILPPTTPAGGIPWEKVLPPLIPRLNGTYGQYNWSPKLIIPETDNSSSAEVTCDDSGFTVQVGVKHFNPEDLIVKVIGDFVEVQGKHEERKDGPGFTTRQFNRRYRIPKGVDTMALESAVSPDGILIISAPMLHTQSYTPLT